MAVKVDIVLDWSGDLGPLRLAGTVAALLPPRLFQRDIALVAGDVAPVADGDIDLSTFALGPALMLPRLEILSRRARMTVRKGKRVSVGLVRVGLWKFKKKKN